MDSKVDSAFKRLHTRAELEAILKAKARDLGYTRQQTRLFIAHALASLARFAVKPQ